MDKKITLLLCQRVVLCFRKQFSRNFLLKLVGETKQLYFLPTLANYYFVLICGCQKGFITFFSIVINFLGVN
jgi:hypothetical protein